MNDTFTHTAAELVAANDAAAFTREVAAMVLENDLSGVGGRMAA